MNDFIHKGEKINKLVHPLRSCLVVKFVTISRESSLTGSKSIEVYLEITFSKKQLSFEVLVFLLTLILLKITPILNLFDKFVIRKRKKNISPVKANKDILLN